MSGSAADTARTSWIDCGEFVHCDSYGEMLEMANDMASEYLQVMTDRDHWFLEHIHSLGSLFLVPRTNVANGGKVTGANHVLTTKKASRYTGGLWVSKLLNIHNHQRGTTGDAAAKIGKFDLRPCTQEGVVGHAEYCNIRVRRYGKMKVPNGEAAD